jgi:three-Cys-motif partner protein
MNFSTSMSSNYLDKIDDGLFIRTNTGKWTTEKLDYLNRYMGAFSGAMKYKWGNKTYIDLFSGPGKCKIRGTQEIILGSPLISLQHNFSSFFFIESQQKSIQSLLQRCKESSRFPEITFFQKDCNLAVNEIVEKTQVKERQSGTSMNFAFLDPEGFELKMSTIETLSKIRKLDLLIYFPVMGINRCMHDYKNHPAIDEFFGDHQWFNIYQAHQQGKMHSIQRALMDLYKNRLHSYGYYFEDEPLEVSMQNEKSSTLYRLIFVSKHPLGYQLWKKIIQKDVHGQKRLF